MIPNHQQLRLLLGPHGADLPRGAPSPRTLRPSSPAEGERGTFVYFEGGYWNIMIDGAARFQLAPQGLPRDP